MTPAQRKLLAGPVTVRRFRTRWNGPYDHEAPVLSFEAARYSVARALERRGLLTGLHRVAGGRWAAQLTAAGQEARSMATGGESA